MKKTRYAESQTLQILKEAEADVPVPELCRKHGMSSASFGVTPVDDTVPELDQTITITGVAAGYGSGSDTFTVINDDFTSSLVVSPASVPEDAGVVTGAGTITLAPPPQTNLTVSLSSSVAACHSNLRFCRSLSPPTTPSRIRMAAQLACGR